MCGVSGVGQAGEMELEPSVSVGLPFCCLCVRTHACVSGGL